MTEQAKNDQGRANEWWRLWGLDLDLKRRMRRVERELGISAGERKKGPGEGSGKVYGN